MLPIPDSLCYPIASDVDQVVPERYLVGPPVGVVFCGKRCGSWELVESRTWGTVARKEGRAPGDAGEGVT